MNGTDPLQPDGSHANETGVSTHAVLTHLRAALDDPNETTLEQLKAHGWFTPLWMEGSSTTDANDQVAIGFRATELEGCERPVLFTYVDEAQARQHHPDSALMSHNLGVLDLLMHEQALDLVMVDGEDSVILEHSQFLDLRNYMAGEADLESRNAKADEMFIARLNAFMLEACRYCEQQPEMDRLYLAAMAIGGAPMRAALLLDANNALIHQNRLETMYAQHMLPGDSLMVLDRLTPTEQDLVSALSKQEPVYTQQKSGGWWARLLGRWSQPQLAVLAVSISPETESS